MYHARTTKIVSAILAALVLLVLLAHLHSKVGATNTSLPYHFQRPVEPDLQTSALKTNGKIAFMSGRNGFLDIYVMNADGSNQRQLTFGMVNPADGFSRTYTSVPVWSPDGSRIAFKSEFDFHGFNLYLMNADGTRQRRLTRNESSDGDPAWSPDGQRIAFISHRDGNDEVYVINADGRGLRRLTRTPEDEGFPAW